MSRVESRSEIKRIRFHTLYTTCVLRRPTLRNTAMLGPSNPGTNVRCTAMIIHAPVRPRSAQGAGTRSGRPARRAADCST